MNALYELSLNGGYVSVSLNGQLLICDCDYTNIAEAIIYSATGELDCSIAAASDLIAYCKNNFLGATSAQFTSHDIWWWHQRWESENNYEDGD